MSDRDTRLNIEVTAEDRASQTIRDVQDEVDRLEQSDANVDIGADDNATPVLDDVDAKARGLDGTNPTVDVQADDNASRVLDDVEQDVRDLDGRTANVDVRADVDEARRLLDQIDAKLRDLDGRRAGVGVGGAAAAGAAAGAVAGQGIPIVEDFARGATAASDQVIQIEQLSRATGATREEASRLARVWQSAGLDLQDLLDLMANLQSVIRDNPDLREQLNLSLANDGITTFLQTVQNLRSEIDSPSMRNVLQSQLFGEEGQRQVERVLILVRDDLRGAMDDIADSRLISDEDLDNARELNRDAQELAGWWQQVQQKTLEWYGTLRAAGEYVARPDISGTDIVRALTPRTGISQAEREAIYANTAGYFGGAFGPINPPNPYTSHIPPGGQPNVMIVNPPGTPSATQQQQQQYLARNGVRLS